MNGKHILEGKTEIRTEVEGTLIRYWRLFLGSFNTNKISVFCHSVKTENRFYVIQPKVFSIVHKGQDKGEDVNERRWSTKLGRKKRVPCAVRIRKGAEEVGKEIEI